MLHFTKVLHVEDHGFLYFSFKCTPSPEYNKCQVQVWTKGEQCHHFEMEEKEGAWKVVIAPLWIREMETQLEEVICEHQVHPRVFSKFRLPENLGKTGS